MLVELQDKKSTTAADINGRQDLTNSSTQTVFESYDWKPLSLLILALRQSEFNLGFTLLNSTKLFFVNVLRLVKEPPERRQRKVNGELMLFIILLATLK